jgi:hypothetical protein
VVIGVGKRSAPADRGESRVADLRKNH